MVEKNYCYLRYHFFLLLVFGISFFSIAQTPVRVMRVHFSDGAVSDVPVNIVDSITFDYNIGNDLSPEVSDTITSNEVLQRAYYMASMQWTPLRPVPKRGGNYYPEGVLVTGAPYSSVKELNTYLFNDVSYHTFMTAVHSPMSVLYTEDISQSPYHGTNCATYYGAVCSSSVMWALGFNMPYSSNDIIEFEEMERIEHQVVDSLRICDVIWKRGHVQMIYNIEYRDDTLYRIKTFEMAGSNAHIKIYTKAQFLNTWNSNGYVGYRFKKLKYSSEPLVLQDWDPIVYNDYLCPSKGDKAVYRTTDTIAIHIYDSIYDQVVLTKGASLIASDNNNGNLQCYYGLKSGVYRVFLQSDNDKTASASFEVVETNVSYDWCDDGENLKIYFNSSAKPEYASLCYLSGGSGSSIPVSEMDIWRGYIIVPRLETEQDYYCKVIFKGEYGRIINEPIKVEPFESKE